MASRADEFRAKAAAEVKFTVRVDDGEVRKGLRAASRMIQDDVDGVILDFAKLRIVPTARRLAPSVIADTLVAIKTPRLGPALSTTARGKIRRIVGVTNFGGGADQTVNYPIRPKRRKALRLRDGSFVAQVTGPRRAKGQHYLERSIDEHRDGVRRYSQEALTRIVERRILGVHQPGGGR